MLIDAAIRINHGELLDRLTEWVTLSLSLHHPSNCYECGELPHLPDCLAGFATAYIMQARGWYHAPANYVSNNP